MCRHLDALPLSSRQNVKSSVPSVVEVLCAHQCPDPRLLIVLFELLAVRRLVVIQVEQVVGSSALVFLACVEVINLSLKHSVLLLVVGLHAFKPVHLSRVSLLPSGIMFCLLLSELRLSHLLVCHREILIESILL